MSLFVILFVLCPTACLKRTALLTSFGSRKILCWEDLLKLWTPNCLIWRRTTWFLMPSFMASSFTKPILGLIPDVSSAKLRSPAVRCSTWIPLLWQIWNPLPRIWFAFTASGERWKISSRSANPALIWAMSAVLPWLSTPTGFRFMHSHTISLTGSAAWHCLSPCERIVSTLSDSSCWKLQPE